jgi:hypothetical protein
VKKILATGIVVMLVNVFAVLLPASYAFAGNYHNLNSQNRLGFSASQYKAYICLADNLNLCAISNGSGNQMTVDSSGYAELTFIPVGTYNNHVVYQLFNAAGNCMSESSDFHVNLVTSSNCKSSDDHQRWALYGDSNGDYFHNMAEGNLMVTNAAKARYNIYGGTTAQFWHWLRCTPNVSPPSCVA